MSLANRIDDGFSTLVTFSNYPTLEFYPISIKMPGIDGGTPIETTNMTTQNVRTFWLRSLKTLTPMTMVCGYTSDLFDPAAAYAMVNENQEVGVTGPDGFGFDFWGGVVSVEPSDFVEGQRPTVTIVVQPTNNDNNKVEQEYDFTPAP